MFHKVVNTLEDKVIDLQLKESDINLIVDWWRASNRYDCFKQYKNDEILKLETKLIRKILTSKSKETQ